MDTRDLQSQRWNQLNDSMSNHSSLSVRSNPVVGLYRHCTACSRNPEEYGHPHFLKVVHAIHQYSFLVRRISSFLSIGLARFCNADAKHEAITAELIRNVGEEMGSLTKGESHLKIFQTTLKTDLDINALIDREERVTQRFLNEIEQALINSRQLAYVAGILLALETSATPELKVVGELLAYYGQRIKSPRIVDVKVLDREERAQTAAAKEPKNFTLEDFLVLHIVSYETGHRDRLWSAICSDLNLNECWKDLRSGFEFVLDLMDGWWAALAYR